MTRSWCEGPIQEVEREVVMKALPGIVVVTRPTRLEGLRQRWGTRGQAMFLMRAAQAQAELAEPIAAPSSKPGTTKQVQAKRGQSDIRQQSTAASMEADFAVYEREADVYDDVLEQLKRELNFDLPIKFLDRSFVPNFDFSRAAVVVVVGQDGLVANTAKYVGGLPIVAVNPDPQRIDGLLLPFQVSDARSAVGNVLAQRYPFRSVTLAEVTLNDQQRLLAFNDVFIGASSHISARYTIRVQGNSEPQSSSGVLISTGVGSTGWMSSVFNMAAGVAQMLGGKVSPPRQLAWEDRQLLWAVREPFRSKTSRAGLVAGVLPEGDSLVLESLMPTGGVIFSDGMESDYLPFNTGVTAVIRAADQRARLVTP